jgi:hypothetical protein
LATHQLTAPVMQDRRDEEMRTLADERSTRFSRLFLMAASRKKRLGATFLDSA